MRAPYFTWSGSQFALFIICLLLGWSRTCPAQSRRLQRLEAALTTYPNPTLAREQALWALAWDKEVSPARQDSLATAATGLATQLADPVGQLAGRVAAARTQLAVGQREAARALLLPVLAQARRRGNAWLQVLALIQLGRTYWGTAQHARAQGCWQQAWAAAQRQPDPYWRVRTATLQANFTNNYALGLDWYLHGLHLAEQADCQACQAEILGSMGYNYELLGELAQAARYATRALRLQQQLHNVEGQKLALDILAGLRTQQGQYAAALAAYHQVARLPGHSLADSLATASGRADIYVAQGRYALGGTQARQGLALARQLGNLDMQALLEATLADVHLQQGQRDSALHYARLAYAHRQRGGGHLVTARTCRVLAQAYAARHDYAQAYAFEQQAAAYADTLTNDKIRSRVAQARDGYELAQRQRRIAQLERDQALGQLRRQRQLAGGGLGVLLLLGGAGAAVWVGRQRQRRRLAALRAQLATDLHDEVGTLLTRVSVQAELLQSLPASQQPPVVAGLLRNSRAAASTLRDVVWGIDTRADSAGSLVDRMREYLHQTAGAAGWHTELIVHDWPDEGPLPTHLRQAVYRIFKEAVTNALRHARGATRLHVALGREAGRLHLTLIDDGQPGRPPTEAATGLGLRNMRQRAADLSGHLQAVPQAGGGWRVHLEVPLPG